MRTWGTAEFKGPQVGHFLLGALPAPQYTRVTPVAPSFQLGKEPGKAWALAASAPHTTQRNPRCQKAVDVRGCRMFASPLFNIPQELNKEGLEGGMPSTNCRVGLFCLWRRPLKLQLPPFYFCPIEERLAPVGREVTTLRNLCSSKARKLLCLATERREFISICIHVSFLGTGKSACCSSKGPKPTFRPQHLHQMVRNHL